MAKIIALLGSKGGTGKTTLSHLIAHGLGLLGRHAVAALTDRDREPLAKGGRLYLPVDARTPEALARVAARLRLVDGWYGVLDGAGNRPDADQSLCRLADLVLLPFRDSQEDVRTVRRDLARLPGALALPSQWPTNLWAREAADRLLVASFDDIPASVLEPVPAISATKLLLQVRAPDPLPAIVNNAARALARRVLEHLGETAGDDVPAAAGPASAPPASPAS